MNLSSIIAPHARDLVLKDNHSATMKYHTIITSLLLAVAQATLNQNLREVATPLENERVSQEVSVSCVKDGRLTLYNCNKCCSNSCKRFSWLLPPRVKKCKAAPAPAPTTTAPTNTAATIPLSPPPTTVVTTYALPGRRPTPSSSYVAAPIFTADS